MEKIKSLWRRCFKRWYDKRREDQISLEEWGRDVDKIELPDGTIVEFPEQVPPARPHWG